MPRLDLALKDEFGNPRQELFKAIASRIKELSQYDHPAEPAEPQNPCLTGNISRTGQRLVGAPNFRAQDPQVIDPLSAL